MSTSVLTRVCLLDLTAKGIRNKLGSVANAQHRQASHKLAQVNLESLRVVNTVRRTAEDDTNDRGVVLGKFVVRKNLAEGVEFAHTTAYKLSSLRTEIQDDNLLLHKYIIVVLHNFQLVPMSRACLHPIRGGRA